MTNLVCVSATDKAAFAVRPTLSLQDARFVVESTRAVRPAWAARSVQERIDLVMAEAAAVGAMNEKIAPEVVHKMGRPVEYSGGFRRGIKRVHHGTVFVAAQLKYRYMTVIKKAARAVIADNTVVLKHATQTLLAGEGMARAFHATGMPQDVFRDVFFDQVAASSLIAENVFDFIRQPDFRDRGLCWTGCGNTGCGGGLSFIGCRNPTWSKSYHLKKVTL